MRFPLLAGLTISCAAASAQSWVHFAVIGDYGYTGQPELDVSNLVHSWNPDFIITTGDNNYSNGAQSTIDANIGQYYHDFISPYVGAYGAGAATNKFFPCLGNHDWVTAGAVPYLNYFTLPGNERYYKFTKGPIEFFCVDSDANEPDGTTSGSVQGLWLQATLAASTATWKIPCFHHPPYNSGASHGNTPNMQWPFLAWGASLVLTGHEHTYERINFGGFTYIVNGLGGRSIYSFGTPVPGSLVRYNANYGAMLADASEDALTMSFVNRGGTVIDTFTLTAPNSILPTSITMVRGAVVSGGIFQTLYSDNSSVTFRPGAVFVNSDPPVQAVFDGISPIQSPSQLKFEFEGSGSAPVLQQKVSFYNFSTLNYDLMDTRIATLTDSALEIAATPAPYIEAGTRAVRAKVSWRATAAVFVYPWYGRADLALWRVLP